jgi:hypothetical protein
MTSTQLQAQLTNAAHEATISAKRMIRLGSAGRAENDARRAAHYGRQALRYSLDGVGPCIRCLDGVFDYSTDRKRA